MLAQYRCEVFLALAGFGFAIVVLSPHYLKIQSAPNAKVFQRRISQDRAARVRWAAYFDLAFAVTYLTLAVTYLESGWLATTGVVAVMIGAGYDEAENVQLLRAVSHLDRVTDESVKRMRSFGRRKWIGDGVGFTLIVLGCQLG